MPPHLYPTAQPPVCRHYIEYLFVLPIDYMVQGTLVPIDDMIFRNRFFD